MIRATVSVLGEDRWSVHAHRGEAVVIRSERRRNGSFRDTGFRGKALNNTTGVAQGAARPLRPSPQCGAVLRQRVFHLHGLLVLSGNRHAVSKQQCATCVTSSFVFLCSEAPKYGLTRGQTLISPQSPNPEDYRKEHALLKRKHSIAIV